MNLWEVWDANEDDEHANWQLIWAWGSDEARQLWWETVDDVEYVRHYGDVRCRLVHRPPCADELSSPPAEPRIEYSERLMRALGWSFEDDRQPCRSCGLYEYGGLVPQCDRCGRCTECGCVCSPVVAAEAATWWEADDE